MTRKTKQADEVSILVAVDDSYVMAAACTLRSVVDHLPVGRRLAVHVLADQVPAPSRDALERSLRSPGAARVCWHEMDFVDLDRVRLNPVLEHISRSTFSRLVLDSKLPRELDRILYLDCDLIVFQDLGLLFDLDMGGNTVLATRDQWIQTLSHRGHIPQSLLEGVEKTAPYFNAGVLLIDVERWRAQGVGASALDLLERHGKDLEYMDQDALNLVLSGRWGELAPRWNQQAGIFQGLRSELFPAREPLFQALRRSPHIVHYTTGEKPWLPGCRHPLRHAFFQVLDRTAWAGWRPAES